MGPRGETVIQSIVGSPAGGTGKVSARMGNCPATFPAPLEGKGLNRLSWGPRGFSWRSLQGAVSGEKLRTWAYEVGHPPNRGKTMSHQPQQKGTTRPWFSAWGP